MKKTTFTTALRIIVFLLIMTLLIGLAGKVYLPYDHEESSQSASFYDRQKDTVDILIVGSSNVRNGISSNELWNNYGLTAYTRGNSRQAPELAYFNFKEALKYQKPKLLILGVTQLFKGFDYVENEPFLRKGLDYKKFSYDKLETAAKFTKMDSNQNIIDYAFLLVRYHSRWTDITYDDVKKTLKMDHDYRHGQYQVKKIKELDPRSLNETDSLPAEYDINAWEEYRKTIELAQENDIDVLVVVMPDDRWTLGMHKTADKLFREAGADFVDANVDSWIIENDIIWDKDFYDARHLNYEGCRKASDYFGRYIIENYDIPQWECSEDLAEQLDADYVLYKQDYNDFMTTIYNPIS